MEQSPQTMILELRQEMTEKLNGKADSEATATAIDNLQTQSKNYITHKQFAWVMGMAFAVLIGVLGYIVVRVDTINGQTNETNVSVGVIQEKLKPLEFILE